MIKEILKRPLFWLGLWIAFILLIFLCSIGHAKLKMFLKGYPRFIIQGDNLVWQIDTVSTPDAEELAWERSKFDIIIEGYPVQYPNARRFFYEPTTTLLPLDTVFGEGSFPINSNWIDKYDSLLSFCVQKGIDYESMFVHINTNEIYDYNTVLTQNYFLQGWSNLNDTNNDNIRDYIGTYGKALRYGLNYLIKDSSMSDWTTNYYADSFGVYEIKGDFIDTIAGNSTDSLWWNVGDTTNLVTNSGFETGDSLPTGWTRHGEGRLLRTNETAKEDSYSVKVNGTVGYGDVAIKQLSIQTPLHCDYIFRAWYKTDATYIHGDTTRPVVKVGRADIEGLAMSYYYIPTDSADGNWHLYCDTFNSYYIDDEIWIDSMVIYLGVFQAYDDTSWNEDDSIYFDEIDLIPLNGYLQLYGGVYPYVIDRLETPIHSSIAPTESTARANFDWYFTNWICNIGNPNYVQFQKQYLTQLFNIRPYFDGAFLDQLWQYCPDPARSRVNEYTDDESGSGNNQWTVDLKILLQAINDTLDISNKMTLGNCNNEMDTAMVRYLDGQFEEGGAINPYGSIASNFDSFNVGSHYPYNFHRGHLYAWKIPADLNKLNLLFSGWNGYEQTSSAEAITRYDTIGQMGKNDTYIEQYESTFAGRNRARVTSLANYYLGASDSTYYMYEINYGYLPFRYYWAGLLDIDIGDPIDTAYEFASGTDDSGLAYVIIGRKYAGGTDTDGDTVLVLYKPKSYGATWWSCWTLTSPYGFDSCQVQSYNTSATDFDPYPATTHNLPSGGWFKYNWTGFYDGGFYTTISLRFNEGCILRQVCP